VRGLIKFERSQWGSIALAMAALLAASYFLGGASRQHELRLALVELSALPLLLLGGFAVLRGESNLRSGLAASVLIALVALPLLQLIPLPPAIWTHLPNRDDVSLALNLAGLSPGWSPLSLTPDRTWRSFLALIPPVAMFVGVLSCPAPARRRFVFLLLCAVVLAIGLGAAQLVSGGDRLYPWRTTDAGNVVGFFANRNHLATFCLLAIPFGVVLGSSELRRDHGGPGLWLAIMFVALAVVTLGVIRSRAGVLLVWPVLGASLLAAWVAAGRGKPKPLLLALVGGATVATIAVALLGLNPLLARFDSDGAPEGRFENWPVVAEAANAYLPVGSGIGSFDAVYRSVEPLDRLDATFFNQAHNEYLETWLEAGWLGIAVLIAFLVWYVRRLLAAWKARPSTERDLQRAASIAIGVVLLHSGADYPLRTETIAVVFAFCCALLELAGRSDAELDEGRDHRRRRRPTSPST
jgi:O-antigen ligase